MKIELKSLRMQVFLIASIGTAIPAIALTGAFYFYLTGQLRQGLERKADSITRFAAANMAAFIEFEDREGAMDIVGKLTADPDVDYVLVLTPDGKTFGEAGATPPPGTERKHWFRKEGRFASGDRLHVVWPAARGSEVLGVVQIGFSLGSIVRAARRVGWVAAVAALLLTVVIAVSFTLAVDRTAVRPVIRMTRRLERLSGGDLREDGERAGAGAAAEVRRMGEALDRFAAALGGDVRSIRESARELAGAADDVLVRSDQLAGAASEQAAAVSESSATMAEIERTSRMTADSAAGIAGAARASVQVSGEGQAAVQAAISRYGDVRGQMEGIVSSVRRLAAELDEADQIVGSVSDIAHQSQLLAINASIEAAKAGVAGRGFAVVAREIRDLSLQSKRATERVRETLGRVGAGIAGVAQGSREGQEATERGAAGIEHAGQVIRGLATVIGTTAESARMIETNVNQEVVGLEQMSRAVGGIEETTRVNLEEVRALGRMGDRLRAKAAELERLVARFELPDSNGPASGGEAPAGGEERS